MAILKNKLPKKINLLSTSSLFLKINENTKPEGKLKYFGYIKLFKKIPVR